MCVCVRHWLQGTFDDAIARVGEEHAIAKKANKILHTESKDDENPQVLEYIQAGVHPELYRR